MPPVAYPLQWLESNLYSKERIDILLKPELESGTINLHDFELAKSFLPSLHRHFPFIYANIFALGTFIYGAKVKRTPWSRTRLVSYASISTFVGSMLGFQRKLDSHMRFANALEDPVGFNKALQNINLRLGSATTTWDHNIGIITSSQLGDQAQPPSDDEHPANENVNWDAPKSAPSAQRLASQPTNIASRWDQIRTANNKSVSSTWDAIRQAHERTQTQNLQNSESRDPDQFPFQVNDETVRARDEAQFDAMLESERRRMSRS